jgi:hypothetical protein
LSQAAPRRFASRRSVNQSAPRLVDERCPAAFGASTTAQGVETEDQLRRIGTEGCTEVKGYIFGKPMPAEEVPALLAHPPAVRT